MNLVAERAEYDAAGALAEELPWWGYLKDGRTCLTQDGQLLCVGRITPSPLDGRTPEALDAVLERWTRLLSNVEPGGRLQFLSASGGRLFFPTRNPITAIACRQLRAGGARHSLANDCRTSRHIWSGVTIRGYKQATATDGRGPWWLNTARAWLARQRAPQEAVYIYDEIEAAASRFRQLVDAGSKLVSDLTQIDAVERPGRGPFLE